MTLSKSLKKRTTQRCGITEPEENVLRRIVHHCWKFLGGKNKVKLEKCGHWI